MISTRSMKQSLRLIGVLLIALAIVPSAFSQETTAGFQGTIKDPSGAVIVHASIDVAGPALIGIRTATTDNSGGYRFSALPAGVYTMTVRAPGFRTYKQTDIDLLVGRLPNIDVQLQVGAVAETVEVSSQAPAVDVTQSKVAVTVSSQILDNIPKGRSFESVIPFAPGARGEPLQAGGYQIDGASNSENVYTIDGVNTTNIKTGGSGKAFQMDFVEEVQVKSSSFEAEYGGALGGVINAVGKRGSNDIHGSLVTYLRMNKFNANNGDRTLQADPTLAGLNNAARLDATYRYYNAVKDDQTILEPGFTLGGSIVKDKLWFFTSYIPQIQTTWRNTNFTGANPGPRRLTQTFDQQNAYTRLDYSPFSKLRLYSSWNYAYSRTMGTLSTQTSAAGQLNSATATISGTTTDPNTLRSDAGTVNPLSVYNYGADWTPTSKLVVSARWGYFFNNNEQRGAPTGFRYAYSGSITAATKDIAGNAFPASSFQSSGFANIPSNLATAYNAYKRDGLDLGVSYYTHVLGGTHNLKAGFFSGRQSNDILVNLNGGYTVLYPGQSYQPQTNLGACDAIIAANRTTYGTATANAAGCTGQYGYFSVGNAVVNTGGSTQTSKALYFQDAWQVGHGLTLNLGIRFDQETQPPYDPSRFPTVDFGWGDKIAPRLGAAYDLLHNGKVKVYASYGKFYDIMKMGLAQGSFGSDYWHNCVYALDSLDLTKIVPTYPIGGGCPATGSAPGIGARFIENLDLRATKADPRDPAISPTMKPMLQHEFVAGADWAINKNWSATVRYSRKRLDNTIEDMSITDSLGFYIGNPGTPFADLLHRPTSIPCGSAFNGVACVGDASGNYLNNTPFCAECPKVIPASRRYDSLEFRIAKAASGKWFGAFTYAYSSLRGNYPGLTNTDPTDGGTAGRASPNNSRLFDLPTMTYTPSGQIDDGPLNTNRPNTASLYGYYSAKWMHMSTNFGFTQIFYQGSSVSSCISVLSAGSACQWSDGRGNFAQLSRAANGDIVKGGVTNDARAPVLTQTDLNVQHIIPIHERMHLQIEATATNLFNQRQTLEVYENILASGSVSPARASRFSGDPNIDWNKVMTGYNYIDAVNATGAFAGNVGGGATGTKIQTAGVLSNRFGLPNTFQNARTIRLAVRFTF